MWSLRDESPELFAACFEAFESRNSQVLESVSRIGKLPFIQSLDAIDTPDYVRPAGSRRAFYLKSNSEPVIAVKGTEPLSEELRDAFVRDRTDGYLRDRPWTVLENFVYREQKAPLALGLNEALHEAKVGLAYQEKILSTYGYLEEAPLPIFVLKLPWKISERYATTAGDFLSERAREICQKLVLADGLGVLIYHYPYLPLRVRWQSPQATKEGGKTTRSFLKPLDNLIEIVARLLLAEMLPFGREDFGTGQLVAPQNVTYRGGVCDVGSVVTESSLWRGGREVQNNLKSTGVLLTRTAIEMLVGTSNDAFFEFETPSLLSYRFSALVHSKLTKKVYRLAEDHALSVSSALELFLSNSDSSFEQSLFS